MNGSNFGVTRSNVKGQRAHYVCKNSSLLFWFVKLLHGGGIIFDCAQSKVHLVLNLVILLPDYDKVAIKGGVSSANSGVIAVQFLETLQFSAV